MMRIIAPNKEYAGVSAGVSFANGEGYTDNGYLIEWFQAHGYKVVPETEADSDPEGEQDPNLEEELDSDPAVAPAQMEEKKPARKRAVKKE